MSWTILERLETALHADPTLSAPMRALVQETVYYIRDLEDEATENASSVAELEESGSAFADLVRDIKGVLSEHGV